MSLNLQTEYHPDPSKNPALADWKRNGGRAIGCLCAMVPVEIINAAGLFPLRLVGNRETVERSREYFSNYSCYFVQSILESALNGGCDLLDGVVFSYTCDCIRFLSAIWEKVVDLPYFYFLNNPHCGNAEGAETFFMEEMKNFVNSLEELSGGEISDESLLDSIQLYNRLRSCYQRIDELRIGAKISGSQAAELTLYGLMSPPSIAVERLTRIISEGDFTPPAEGPRVMALGGVHPDLDIFHLVESLGGNIIADDFCMVGRCAEDEIDITEDDLLFILSRFYLNQRTQCPCMTTEGRFQRRLDYIMKKIKLGSVDGVVFTIQRYCDPHQLDYPDLSAALADRGIPTLLVEVEQSIYSEPIKNRLEAFVEMLS
ncbi:MAG TPA: 2-hydroxyacyl-CoA dehydratase [Candidatus Latescibacteria bacterium]|nr:2-hydroxyacyl-CoA dehydratase [Candidatus Latescibacterota bacterium]